MRELQAGPWHWQAPHPEWTAGEPWPQQCRRTQSTETRRLDRSAPVWRGRATQIGAVQTSGVRFADPGCWRVTGRVGGKALSYVVRVAFTRA